MQYDKASCPYYKAPPPSPAPAPPANGPTSPASTPVAPAYVANKKAVVRFAGALHPPGRPHQVAGTRKGRSEGGGARGSEAGERQKIGALPSSRADDEGAVDGGTSLVEALLWGAPCAQGLGSRLRACRRVEGLSCALIGGCAADWLWGYGRGCSRLNPKP